MGWMKNKGVAVGLLIVAIAVLGYVYKTQMTAKEASFTLKAKDGTIFEKVTLPSDTQFPIEYQGKKDCKPAIKYWDAKTKKVVFLTPDEKIDPSLTPGDEPKVK